MTQDEVDKGVSLVEDIEHINNMIGIWEGEVTKDLLAIRGNRSTLCLVARDIPDHVFKSFKLSVIHHLREELRNLEKELQEL